MAQGSLTPQRSGRPVGFVFTDPFLSLHREMNRLFDDVLRAAPVVASNGATVVPNLDVSETANEIRVRAELPGVSEQDIDVSVQDDVLTIRAEKKQDRREEREDFHVVESSYGIVRRSLRLPFAVDPSQVQARFENGVLTVTLPKTQRAERSGRIQVQGPANRAGSDQGSQAGAEQAAQAPDQAGRTE